MPDRSTPHDRARALPGRARAPRKAQHRRARLASLLSATGTRRPRPHLDSAPRRIPGLEVTKPSNISLTPPSSRLDLPPVPPRQRPRDPTLTTRPPTRAQSRRPPYQTTRSGRAALPRPASQSPGLTRVPARPAAGLRFRPNTKETREVPGQPSRSTSWRGVITSNGSSFGSTASKSRSPVTIASAPLAVASATR